MTIAAMALVLASALLHAGWNVLAKKSNRKIVFIWWFLLVSAVLYLPMFLYFLPKTVPVWKTEVKMCRNSNSNIAQNCLLFFVVNKSHACSCQNIQRGF